MKRLSLAALFVLGTMQAAAQMMPMTPSYQGLWWNAPAGSESGWGVNLTHQGNILFATWFTYDADGKGMWLVMPKGDLQPAPMNPYGYGYGEMEEPPTYTGALYRTTGPAFDSASFNSAAVAASAVGDATFRFTSEDSGSFSYNVNGVAQTKQIVRQVYAMMPVCDFSGSGGAAPNFQDLWWRSPAVSESGWGVNLTHQGDILFATWFTYEAGGRGLWLVMPAGMKTANNTYSGALYRTTGPAFNATPWNGAQVTATAVGTATFTFGDANNGTFTAVVEGATQSKSITRQVYSAPATTCRP